MFTMRKQSVGLAAVCFVFAAAAVSQAQQNAEEAAPTDNTTEVVENAMQAPVVMNEAPAPAVMNETAVPAEEGVPAQAPAEGAPQTTAAPAATAASAVPATAAVSAGADQKAVQAIAETAPQAKVMEMFRGLADNRRLAFLLITHDFGIVRHLADRVYVMNDGDILESGKVADVLDHPQQDYTRALIEAAA